MALTRLAAAVAVLAALAAQPAYAEDPFKTSEELCSGDYNVRCSKKLTAEAVERTPTIGDFMKISGQSIDQLRSRNNWSDEVTPKTKFRPGVRIVLWETL